MWLNSHCDYYAPAPSAWALSDDAVCLSVWLLSVTYIGPKSRTERPRKTKIGIEVAHITRDSDTTFRVKRLRSQGRGILWRSPAELANVVLLCCRIITWCRQLSARRRCRDFQHTLCRRRPGVTQRHWTAVCRCRWAGQVQRPQWAGQHLLLPALCVEDIHCRLALRSAKHWLRWNAGFLVNKPRCWLAVIGGRITTPRTDRLELAVVGS